MKGLFSALCRACQWSGRTDKPAKDRRGETITYTCPKCGAKAVEIA